MEKKEIFTILGSTGFIGNALANFLHKKGHYVSTPERNLNFNELSANLKGHVIYCIGLTSDFRSRPWETIDAHIGLLRKLLPIGNFDSFTYISSTRVYEDSENGHENSLISVRPIDTDQLFNISKLMGESLCNWASIQGQNVRSVRLSNVLGNDYASENFFYSLLNEAITKKSFHFKSSLDSAKDYITLYDSIRMLEEIAINGKYSCYNLASGIQIRHSQIANIISELTGATYSVEENAKNIFFPPIDITRISNEFGFVPQHPIDALVDCIKDKIF